MTFELKTDNELENIVGGTIIPYRVQPEDTLEQLAKKFKCSVEDICRWNNIKELKVNQKIIFKF